MPNIKHKMKLMRMTIDGHPYIGLFVQRYEDMQYGLDVAYPVEGNLSANGCFGSYLNFQLIERLNWCASLGYVLASDTRGEIEVFHG